MRQHGDTKSPLVASTSMNSCDCADSRVSDFLWLHCATPHPRCLQPIGGRSVLVRDPAALGLIPPSNLPPPAPRCSRLFYSPKKPRSFAPSGTDYALLDEMPASVLFSLMALRMLKCDEHGNPTLTDLAEAALERMRGKLH